MSPAEAIEGVFRALIDSAFAEHGILTVVAPDGVRPDRRHPVPVPFV